MIPAPFEYEVAESAEHAIELLGSKEDAKLIAGGHSLLPLMKFRLARPATLVDIGRLSDLAGVRDGGDHLAIGALTRHHDLEHDALVQEQCPILAYAAGVGRRPAGATPGHDRRLAGPLRSGRRLADGRADAGRGDRAAWARRRARDAGRGVLPRLLRDDVRAGRAGRRGARAENRRSGLVVCQVPPPCTRLGDRGRRRGRRGQRLDRASPDRPHQHGSDAGAGSAAEQALAGAAQDGIAAAAAKADEGTNPPGDTWASSDFRRHLARVLTARAVEEALSR